MQAACAVRGSASGGLSLIWRIRACASRVTGPHDEALGSSRTASVARALEARWATIRAVRSQSDSVSPLRTRKGPPFRKGAACLMPPPVPWSVASCEYARRRPRRAPSPSARTIWSPRWCRLMMTSVIPCRLRSRRFHSRICLPATGSSGFGNVSVSGRSRVPSPAARTIAFISDPPSGSQLRHVAGKRFAERVEVPVVLQVPPHIAQGPRDVLEIAIIVLLQGNIDEPPGCLEVSLDAGQVEESQERHAVERRARLGPSFQVADDQFVDQGLVERQIGVPQQGCEVVGGGAHQGVLEVEDAQAPALHHEIATVVVPMSEDAGLRRHRLGDLPHLAPDGVTIFLRQRLAGAFLDAILDEVIELPH